MKPGFLVALLSGALIGSGLTYLVLRSANAEHEKPQTHTETAHSEPDKAPAGRSGDPFEEADEASSGESADPFAGKDRSAHGYGRMNMKSPFERDICISFWYHDMSTVVDSLELHTGHKFKRQVGKLYAGPVEILEEQIAFMKEFLAETERLREKSGGEE